MGVDISGWIEVKRSYPSHEGEWLGVIKIDPFIFNFRNREFRASLYSIGTEGLPADASSEVKTDWNPDMDAYPCFFNWEDAWKIDTEYAPNDWWILFEMVEALGKLGDDYYKLSFRFVYWV